MQILETADSASPALAPDAEPFEAAGVMSPLAAHDLHDPSRPLSDSERAGATSTSSLGRLTEILGLFSLATPTLRITDLVDRLNLTRSTAYRYTAELCAAGLLSSSPNGVFSLGPRIMELERLLELTDPLYRAGTEVLPALRAEDSVLLLQNLYGDKVLCIHKEGPDRLEFGGRRFTIKRARGLPFPLFRGAASLVLLAAMSAYRIREIYLRNQEAIRGYGLGDDWLSFRKTLAAIRRKGYAVSRGQFSPLIVGIAVPIRPAGERRVVGSLVKVFPSEQLDPSVEIRCAETLQAAAARIGEAYLRCSRA
ncbi:MAG: IclR family transcriptional regulator [Lautropia sp.]